MLREIIFDTETTGLNPLTGDRIVEIGCVEILNMIPTGESFHAYINPERDMPDGAFRVHGLSAEFLADKPVFAQIAQEFLDFIGDSPLVAHNASFDMGFINAELSRLKISAIPNERVVDTLVLARRKHPFGPNSLDALCQRYSIDNSRRTKHGALLDAEILAEVYIELLGGRQTNLGLSSDSDAQSVIRRTSSEARTPQQRSVPLKSRLSETELAAHTAFVATLSGEIVWKNYIRDGEEV